MLRIEIKSYKLDFSKDGEFFTTFQLMTMFQMPYSLLYIYCIAKPPTMKAEFLRARNVT
jgi:hypothetical protein